MSLKSLPVQERPRERLLRDGMEALSIPELLAIVLGHGTRGKSVLELSSEILNRFGGLEKLLEASVVELMEIKGIGQAKAIQLQAVLGIARRWAKSQGPSSPLRHDLFGRSLQYCQRGHRRLQTRGAACHVARCARLSDPPRAGGNGHPFPSSCPSS